MNLASLRKEYSLSGLTEEKCDGSPFNQFSVWFSEARNAGIEEPNAMTLATVSARGMPSARILLLKHFDENGFVFFTNYESRKGHDLEHNPNACILFFWHELQRQVRIQGSVQKITREQSAEYFLSRPLESRIGAWASEQSSIIENRTVLEENFNRLKNQFGDDVPVPDFWGGYCLSPIYFEFWQGRESRLHDRITYTKENNEWIKKRISP